MDPRSLLKRSLRRVARRFGYTIDRLDETNSVTLEAALRRLAALPVEVNSVIDVGASDGTWSKRAARHLPHARYHLIEANPFHDPALLAYRAAQPNVDFVLKAAGDRVGEVYFDASDPLAGVASNRPFARPSLRVPVTTIDAEVHSNDLRPPFLLKLDTHGFEMPILEGAAQTLPSTNVLVIEVYNFRISEESLLFWEMCAELAERGFRPAFICDPLFRPRDQLLWQFDVFFLRANQGAFQLQGYR